MLLYVCVDAETACHSVCVAVTVQPQCQSMCFIHFLTQGLLFTATYEKLISKFLWILCLYGDIQLCLPLY